MSETTDLPSGLRVYADEVAAVLSFMPDWISQDEFDAKAFDANIFGVDASKPCEPKAFDEGSYVLFTANSFGPYYEAIGLVQAMMRHDMVKARKKNGKIHYKSTKPAL